MERKKIKLSISETANVIKPTVSEKNGEIHASPTFHNAYLLMKNNVQKLPIIDCVTRFLDMEDAIKTYKASSSAKNSEAEETDLHESTKTRFRMCA